MSRLKEALQSDKFLITVAVPPPKGVDPASFLERLSGLAGKVDAVTLPDNRSAKIHLSSFAAAMLAKERGLEAILTLSCRDKNRLALSSELLGAHALGIENILCVTGDYISFGDATEAKPVYDLDSVQAIQMIRRMEGGKDIGNNDLEGAPSFCVGCVANPQAVPMEPHLLKLRKKLEAGAEFIQTLDIFDLDKAMPFFEQQKRDGIKLLAGLRLITEHDVALSGEGRLPGNPIPDDIIDEIGGLTDSESVIQRSTTRLIEDIGRIKDSGLCDGVHLTAERHEDLIPRILQEAGL